MKQAIDFYYRILKIAITILLATMLVPVSLQIVSRYTDGYVPHYIWTEEVARFSFVWIIMIGSMLAVRDGSHFVVDVMPSAKSDRELGLSNLLVHLCMLVMAIVFAWFGIKFAKFGSLQTSEMSGINMLSMYVAFPIAGLTWIIFLLEKILADWKLVQNKVGSGNDDSR